MKRILLAIVAFIAATGSSSAAVVGITWSGEIWSLNPATNISSKIGSTYGGNNALALDSKGRPIYWTYDDIRFVHVMATFDPVTGIETKLIDLVPGAVPLDFRGLAFGNGILYGIADFSDNINLSTPDHLVSIDLATGVVTDIATLFSGHLQSLAWYDDSLYSYSLFTAPGGGLYRIDPATGAETFLFQPDLLDIQTLEFLPGGSLIGGRDKLYVFDLNAKDYREYADFGGPSTQVDIRGIAYIPVPVPLPAAAGPFLVALAWLGGFAAWRCCRKPQNGLRVSVLIKLFLASIRGLVGRVRWPFRSAFA